MRTEIYDLPNGGKSEWHFTLRNKNKAIKLLVQGCNGFSHAIYKEDGAVIFVFKDGEWSVKED